MCVPADSNLQLAENVLELKEPKTKDNIEQSPKGDLNTPTLKKYL